MMKTARTFMLGTTIVIATVACLAVFIGCSQSPVGPATSNNGLDAIAFVESQTGGDPFSVAQGDSNALSKNIGQITVDYDAVLVDSKGGTVELLLGENASHLTFPKGALSWPTMITALGVSYTTRWGDVTFYDFAPDGLIFNVPATLTLAADLPSGQRLTLWWYNPDTGYWEGQQAAKADANGNFVFTLHHFSKYAIT